MENRGEGWAEICLRGVLMFFIADLILFFHASEHLKMWSLQQCIRGRNFVIWFCWPCRRALLYTWRPIINHPHNNWHEAELHMDQLPMVNFLLSTVMSPICGSVTQSSRCGCCHRLSVGTTGSWDIHTVMTPIHVVRAWTHYSWEVASSLGGSASPWQRLHTHTPMYTLP